MTWFFWISFVFSIIYFISILIYWIGLYKPVKPNFSGQLKVSVVVAARNEVKRLPKLLECIEAQDYPSDLYEVIIIDNDSDDGTYELLQEQSKNFPNLKVLTTKERKSGYKNKKAALCLGIECAEGEIILTTDADCLMDLKWVSTMVGYFSNEVGMVAGFSGVIYDKSVFWRLQALDFLQLMAADQGTLNLGIAWACSGQNLAFRKSLFQKVGGYKEIINRVGGDDSLFMQVIKKGTKTKIVFASDSSAWVENEPIRRFSTFVRQRIRWASEANYMHKLNVPFFTVVFSSFITNLVPIIYLLLLFLGISVLKPLLFFLGLKLLGEGILFLKATDVYNRRDLRRTFFLWYIFQMPYVVFMGMLSFWGNRLKWGNK